MSKLFGTDGIRGKAGEFPIDKTTMKKLGFNLAKIIIERDKSQPKIIIGYDTRQSSKDIFKWIAEGINQGGGEVLDAGVVSTPLLSFLSCYLRKYSVAITASHNPYEDNGVKIIGEDGLKLLSEIEEIIEKNIFSEEDSPINRSSLCIKNIHQEAVEIYYEELIKRFFNFDLKGMNIALDLANGAAYEIIPMIFSRYGADVEIYNNKPNGRNINDRCGALFPEHLKGLIKERKIDIGISFDGDADRAIFIDNEGRIYDGDLSLAIIAQYFKKKEKLNHNTVVATIMSNYGLEKFLIERGMKLLRVPVGDKYVIEKMLQENLNLGGEQSGHIILSDISKTGDGLITALLVIKILKEEPSFLHSIVQGFERYPQTLINVRIKNKIPFEDIPGFNEKHNEIINKLRNRGRIVVRYSGTEPLLRIMVEGEEINEIKEYGESLAGIAERYLA